MAATDMAKLLQLQQLDMQLRSLRQKLDQPESKAAFSKTEAAAKQILLKLKKTEAALAAMHKQVRAGELALATIEAEMKDTEAALYGGAVTSSRELAGMEQKLALAKTKHAKQEEELLAGMQEEEALRGEATQLRKQAQVASAEYGKAKAVLDAETGRLHAEVEKLERERRSLVAGIEQRWLDLYTRLRQQRPDMIAKVEGAACGACHVELPPAVSAQAAAGVKPTYCESCGRLLCVL